MSGIIAGVGLQPKWMTSTQLQSSSGFNNHGRFRIKMTVSSVDEKKKTYTLQKSEEAFSKAKVCFLGNKYMDEIFFLSFFNSNFLLVGSSLGIWNLEFGIG